MSIVIPTISMLFCGQGWIRTTELRRGQIYSLLPLATWLLTLLCNCEPMEGFEPPTR